MNIFPQKIKTNRGMTYVELIVVLSIFSIISSVSLFNYKKFQQKVNIKNLASDIGLKFVEAQKNASYGKYPPSNYVPSVSGWKPSYGLWFKGGSQEIFYFVDLNSNKNYNGSILQCTQECMSKISVPAGSNNSISEVRFFYNNDPVGTLLTGGNNTLHVSFTRPDAGATFYYGPFGSTNMLSNVSHLQLTLVSTQGATTRVRVYSSGRIQVI